MSVYRINIPEDKDVKYESFRYPGGEVQVRLKQSQLEKVLGAGEIHIRARITDGEIMELASLSDALVNLNRHAARILYLPYLPYGRADRRFVEGDALGLSVFGRQLSILNFDYIRTLDAHNPARAQRAIPVLQNLSPESFIQKVIAEIGPDDLTILLPDAGAARYHLVTDVPIVQAEKHRDPASGKLSGFSTPTIETSKVLIIDDICDGGGTFNGISESLFDSSPLVEKKYLYVTHGIFSQGLDKLYKNFNRVYTTNSFDNQKHIKFGTAADQLKVVTL